MRCRTALTRIDALRTGELPAAESSVVHEHLRKCQSCDESVSDLTALTASLKETVVAPPRSILSEITDHFDVITAGGDEVLVAFSDRGLRMITTGVSPDEFRASYVRKFGRDVSPAALPDRLRKQVVSALTGEGVDKPAVDFAGAERAFDSVGDEPRAVIHIDDVHLLVRDDVGGSHELGIERD